jgi:hypothetical protein
MIYMDALIYALGGGRLMDRERIAAERLGLLIYVRDFSLERAAAVAEDDGSVSLGTNKFIAIGGVFAVKSVVEFVADRAKKACIEVASRASGDINAIFQNHRRFNSR